MRNYDQLKDVETCYTGRDSLDGCWVVVRGGRVRVCVDGGWKRWLRSGRGGGGGLMR